MSSDFARKVNCDFPYSNKKHQRSRKSYLMNSIIDTLPEMVEEEDEEVSIRSLRKLNLFVLDKVLEGVKVFSNDGPQ